MSENRHAKFAAYWVSLGKPPLEAKDEDAPDESFRDLDEVPYWTDSIDYRIAGDRHWVLRRAWVDSDFKLRIEYSGSVFRNSWMEVAGNPAWIQDAQYRAAPEQDILEEVATGYPGKIIHVSEIEVKTDPGAHYRYTYRVRLTEADKANGYVDVKLDPARICEVYGITPMMQGQAIKKLLCTGKRGHKDFAQDLRDIRSALDRWEEMLKEDGVM